MCLFSRFLTSWPQKPGGCGRSENLSPRSSHWQSWSWMATFIQLFLTNPANRKRPSECRHLGECSALPMNQQATVVHWREQEGGEDTAILNATKWCCCFFFKILKYYTSAVPQPTHSHYLRFFGFQWGRAKRSQTTAPFQTGLALSFTWRELLWLPDMLARANPR